MRSVRDSRSVGSRLCASPAPAVELGRIVGRPQRLRVSFRTPRVPSGFVTPTGIRTRRGPHAFSLPVRRHRCSCRLGRSVGAERALGRAAQRHRGHPEGPAPAVRGRGLHLGLRHPQPHDHHHGPDDPRAGHDRRRHLLHREPRGRELVRPCGRSHLRRELRPHQRCQCRGPRRHRGARVPDMRSDPPRSRPRAGLDHGGPLESRGHPRPIPRRGSDHRGQLLPPWPQPLPALPRRPSRRLPWPHRDPQRPGRLSDQSLPAASAGVLEVPAHQLGDHPLRRQRVRRLAGTRVQHPRFGPPGPHHAHRAGRALHPRHLPRRPPRRPGDAGLAARGRPAHHPEPGPALPDDLPWPRRHRDQP